jgi:hypothetical protein
MGRDPGTRRIEPGAAVTWQSRASIHSADKAPASTAAPDVRPSPYALISVVFRPAPVEGRRLPHRSDGGIDLRFPCRRDGAIARRAGPCPDKKQLPPPARAMRSSAERSWSESFCAIPSACRLFWSATPAAFWTSCSMVCPALSS